MSDESHLDMEQGCSCVNMHCGHVSALDEFCLTSLIYSKTF